MEQTKQEIYQSRPLSEQGAVLPLGVNNARDLVLRPWRMKEEKELGELREKNRDSNMATYISQVLGTMYIKLGPHNFEAMKLEERRVHISSMFMADIFYAYIWLRLNALGSDLELKIACPMCGKKSQISADLGTVDVRHVPDVAKSLWEYVLKNPINIRGKLVKSLVMGPSRWNAIENIPAGNSLNAGSAKAAMFRGSIVGLNGTEEPALLGDTELDELTKIDIERLTAQLDSKAVGPMMALEHECQNNRCKNNVKMPIDWNYDSFFSSSSR